MTARPALLLHITLLTASVLAACGVSRAEAQSATATMAAWELSQVSLAGPAYAWTASDEAFYTRNRRIAAAGKVLTVLGRIGVVTALATGYDFDDVAYWGALATASTGEMMWSIADLRATNRFNDRGVPVRRGAAIASLVGSFTLAPITWIGGPIASARLRNAHHETGTAARTEGMRVIGATLSMRF